MPEGEKEYGCLLEALDFLESCLRSEAPSPYVIALVGGGGKTTVMGNLAKELEQAGKRVLVTTTTHIWVPESGKVMLWTEELPEIPLFSEKGEIITAGRKEKSGKLAALPPQALGYMMSQADVVLVEADGSKRKPVKVPACHEPVIPAETDGVIACMGLSALGKQAKDVLFRLECWGIGPEERLTEELAVEILASEAGSRKYVGDRCYRVVLNQCDGEKEREAARRMGRALRKQGIHGAAVSWGIPMEIF